jgi:putative NADPH-quinone reductase
MMAKGWFQRVWSNGMAGRYMSVDNGGNAAKTASNIINLIMEKRINSLYGRCSFFVNGLTNDLKK